ncbi:o-succinylbenzoate synthase [Streptomyces sp. SID13031]|uniref:o-succinylbenzoate synthase n=1 Tax=Streptomyces sp. SID13031 TaxID=2706046 RepID=UPI0013CBD895|nr:o-succinylbenzoate synthase [Streptomyces sp. SID13031]
MITYAIGLKDKFRGITVREGMLFEGPAGWAEWSPFLDYDDATCVAWLRAAREAAYDGWPEAVRDFVPVNCTVPAIGPEKAAAIVRASGCATAKVKVAEPGQTLRDDLERVEAVRDAIGNGQVRIDANGAWSVDEALHALKELKRFDLEYVEQPCAAVEDLAAVRRRTDVLVAADESIRRAADPMLVKKLEAADIAVLKVQPIGGVRACLDIAEQIGLPVVVSSALETSIGIAAGVALAAALPELPYACGLATVSMFTAEVVEDPLLPVNGFLPVKRLVPTPELPTADQATTAKWEARLARVEALRGSK